jgi:hypothetical protein
LFEGNENADLKESTYDNPKDQEKIEVEDYQDELDDTPDLDS